MKAITIYRPWPHMIAAGAKLWEVRRHSKLAHLVGERIAIHCGQTFDNKFYEKMKYALGPERARAALVSIFDTDSPAEVKNACSDDAGLVICTARVVDHAPLASSDAPAALCGINYDSWGLRLHDIQNPPFAFYARGAQLSWELEKRIGEPTRRRLDEAGFFDCREEA